MTLSATLKQAQGRLRFGVRNGSSAFRPGAGHKTAIQSGARAPRLKIHSPTGILGFFDGRLFGQWKGLIPNGCIIFNFLGPLLTPARPGAQLVGVPNRAACAPIAAVLRTLGVGHGMAVCGSVGGGKFLDEVSIVGRTYFAEISDGPSIKSFSPRVFPLQPATLNDLTGGDRKANAIIVRRILCGEERGPKRDAVLANAAVAMAIAGQAASYREGWAIAAELIDSGKAGQKLEDLIAHSAAIV